MGDQPGPGLFRVGQEVNHIDLPINLFLTPEPFNFPNLFVPLISPTTTKTTTRNRPLYNPKLHADSQLSSGPSSNVPSLLAQTFHQPPHSQGSTVQPSQHNHHSTKYYTMNKTQYQIHSNTVAKTTANNPWPQQPLSYLFYQS